MSKRLNVWIKTIQTEYGSFELYRYREIGNPDIHLALVKGEPKEGVTTVRVHGFSPFAICLSSIKLMVNLRGT